MAKPQYTIDQSDFEIVKAIIINRDYDVKNIETPLGLQNWVDKNLDEKEWNAVKNAMQQQRRRNRFKESGDDLKSLTLRESTIAEINAVKTKMFDAGWDITQEQIIVNLLIRMRSKTGEEIAKYFKFK